MSWLSRLLAILGRHRPSPPPAPILPQSVSPVMRVSVWAAEGGFAPVVGGMVTLDDPTWPVVAGVVEDGRLRFDLPASTQWGWAATLSVATTVTNDQRIVLAADVDVALPPVWVPQPRLTTTGQFYYREGQPFTIIQCSDFQLYERYLRGEDIGAVLADRRDLGFNTLRVWLLNTSVCNIQPKDFPAFYSSLGPFLDLCDSYGLYVELTVFTQTETLMPSLSEQQAHYDQTVQAVGARFCFIEGANEYDQHDNAFDENLNLWRPSGAIFDLCRASMGADSWACEPVIDSTRYHSNDTDEWQRRCAHNGMEMGDAFSRPNFANENTRPDHDPNTQHHYDAAAGAALLSAGSCFHSNAGKDSTILTGNDRTCGQAWVAGAKSMDLSQRVYAYVHRTDLETSDVIRAYQRGTCIVLIHA